MADMHRNGRSYLDDHVSVPETFDPLSIIVQNGDSLSGLLCFDVLDFALGNILGQEFIHELQRARDLLLRP